MTLASFGVVLLSFGTVILVIALLGLWFGARTSLGGAGLLGLAALVIGAVLFGAGWAKGKRE